MSKPPRIAFIIPTLQGYGGLEKYMLDFALATTRDYPITLISQHVVSQARLLQSFGRNLPLDRVHFLVDPACHPTPGGRIHRFRQRRHLADLSRGYDLVLTSSWLTPWMNYADNGIFVCHFPAVSPQERIDPNRASGLFSDAARRQRNLQRCLDSWPTIVTSSQFGQGWLQTYWQRSSIVLYPGVELPGKPAPRQKEPWVLGCGFFSDPQAGDSYSYKRQELLIEAFRDLSARPDCQHLQLHLAGHVSKDSKGTATLDRLRQLGAGLNMILHPNCDGSELQELYGRSSFFWHGTGYGIDLASEPGRMEHFGMVTVEAMSQGCVPLVFGQGGQREIVEDGLSGHWWFEPGDLVSLTQSLVQDDSKRAQMAQEARIRSDFFASDKFGQRVHQLMAQEVPRTNGS